MPKTRPILDSSPLPVPARKPASPRRPDPSGSARRPSANALPTPPRTKHSRKRKRSPSHSRAVTRRGRVTDSDSEPDDDAHRHPEASDDTPARTTEDTVKVGHKRRRTARIDAIAAELSGQTSAAAAAAAEEAFWTGTTATLPADAPDAAPDASASSTQDKAQAPQARVASPTRGRSRSPTRSPSASPPARLLRRNRTGLISPPPSRRHAAPVTTLPLTPPPPPRRSKRDRSLRKRLFPERDSPNNPFLVSEESPDAVSPPDAGTSTPTPLPYVEKPTITYVFRGVKAEFRNPLFDPSNPTGVPVPGPDDPSTLPLDDLEYSPTPYCPPKLLFPEARKHDHARLRKGKGKDQTATGLVAESGSEGGPDKGTRIPALDAGPSTPKRPSTPTRSSGKGKGKGPSRSHSRGSPKTEWDTSDEEDEPHSVRRGRKHRHEIAGVMPRFPVDVLPVHEEVAEDPKGEEREVEKQLKEMPQRELRRIAKIAPLLLDVSAGER